MKGFRTVLSVVMILMMVMSLLAGCNSSKDISNEKVDTNQSTEEKNTAAESNNESSDADGGVDVSDAKWDTSETRTITLSTIKNYYTTALKQVAEEYTAVHPETKVEIEIIADNETYMQNFKVKMSTDKDKAPDIIHTNLLGDDEGNLVSIGWLHGLDELLAETNAYNGGILVKEGFNDPTYLTLAVSSNGETSHLPFDIVGVGIFYNKTIFDEVGVTAPNTYEEWSEACEKLKDAGYDYPIGATVFNNWVMTSLSDWAYRGVMEEIVSVPGDARYNEETMSGNIGFTYKPEDPAFDLKAIIDPEKKIAYLKGNDMSNDKNKTIWEAYKGIAKYFPENFTTPDDGQAYNEFMAQKTPMLITGSWVVGQTLGEMAKLDDSQKFEWGTFLFPGFSSSPDGFEGAPRGLKVAGHKMGIANKDDEDLYYRAADFLKYMYSQETAAKIYDITFANNEYVQGPSLLKGVELSPEVTGFIGGFDVEGNMRMDLQDFAGNYFAASNSDYHPIFMLNAIDYINGVISWDEFSAVLGEFRDTIVADNVEQFDYDFDPSTNETVE